MASPNENSILSISFITLLSVLTPLIHDDFVLYASLKPNSFKYQNCNYYHFNDDSVWNVSNYSADRWPQNYLFLTSPNINSEEYAETAIAMSYMHYNDVKQWEESSIGKRGKEYEAFKKQKAERLIEQIGLQYPDFKSSGMVRYIVGKGR